MQQRAKNPGSYVATAAFAALLAMPAALAVMGRAGFDTAFIENTEHRVPFVAPAVSSGALATGGWERDAEREIADAFPLRTLLIRANDRAAFLWFGDTASGQVIRGRDGWLFYGAEERDYLAGKPGDDAIAHVAEVYAARAAWCKAHGIVYAVLIAPNKSTIYVRYMRSGTPDVQPSGVDRLIPLLRARGVTVIDPRAALITASQGGEVYSRGDTHWNDAGAYVAYETAVRALQASGVRDAVPRHAIVSSTENGPGDLLALSGVDDIVPNPWVHLTFPSRARVMSAPSAGDLGTVAAQPYATEISDPSLPTLVAFGDSFLDQLRPFFAATFRRAEFRRQLATESRFDTDVLERQKPTVVLQEFVERNLTFGATFTPSTR